MTANSYQETTRVLARLSDGDSSAAAELMPLVYEELRGRAAAYLRRERPDHTLEPTALVHEAYLKLVHQSEAQWKNRAHFLAVAAEAMRRILVDHARRHQAAKRGSDQRMTVIPASEVADRSPVDLIELDDALKHLAALDERQCRVVELRFFGNMTIEEVAHVLEVSPRTVTGDWLVARAWLQRQLSKAAPQ
ncbi:MAG: ECF-type sigma factor [Phycisphaerales bacterium]|nr:ECF-type sigma factor [Phycisphaerales bacterium]